MRSTAETFRHLLTARVPTPYTGRVSSVMDRIGAAATGDRRAQLAAYGSVGTLFAIVHNLSSGFSGIDWHLYRKQVDQRRVYGPAQDTRKEITVHQALKVMQRPNDFMWWQSFSEMVQQHIDLTGMGIAVVDRAGGVPVEWWPVRPDRMRPEPDRETFLKGWTYVSPDGELVPLEVDDVFVIKLPNPSDPYTGMGPVQALMTDIGSAVAAAEWNAAFFRNSAQPGGIIEVETALSDQAFEQMVQRWRESHQGVSNAHRVGILEHGKWRDVNFSMKDMQFAELRSVAREIIREAFSYPKFMLGQPEGSNRASAMAAEYVEARRLLVPRADRWKGALNWQYLPMFGATGEGVEFDYDSPVPDDEDAEAARVKVRCEAWAILVGQGVPPEVAAEIVCLPPDLLAMTEPPPPPPVIAPPMPPAEPGEGDDGEREPADDESPEEIAARALEILRSGGLQRAIINGHSFSSTSGTGGR